MVNTSQCLALRACALPTGDDRASVPRPQEVGLHAAAPDGEGQVQPALAGPGHAGCPADRPGLDRSVLRHWGQHPRYADARGLEPGGRVRVHHPGRGAVHEVAIARPARQPNDTAVIRSTRYSHLWITFPTGLWRTVDIRTGPVPAGR